MSDSMLWHLGFRPCEKGFFRYVNGSFDTVVRCNAVVYVEKSNGGIAIGLPSDKQICVSDPYGNNFKPVRELALGITELRLCAHGAALDADCPECDEMCERLAAEAGATPLHPRALGQYRRLRKAYE